MFFEVLAISSRLVLTYVENSNGSGIDRKNVSELIRMFHMESCLDGIDVMNLLRDRQERQIILNENNMQDLAQRYDREIGQIIIASA